MSRLAYNAGLIIESDLLSLSGGLIIKGDLLIDQANGAGHQLSKTARLFLILIKQPLTIKDVKSLIGKKNINNNQIREILNFLDGIGGLDIKRSRISELINLLHRLNLILHFSKLDKPAQRHTGDIKGIVKASRNAVNQLVPMMLITAVMGYGLNISLNTNVLFCLLFYLCLILSTISHEYLHLYYARKTKGIPVILRRGMRLGLLHKTLPKKYELRSVILGPLVGALAALVFSLLSYLSIFWFAWIVAISIAFFHLVSWLPIYGDGMVLREIYKGNYDA